MERHAEGQGRPPFLLGEGKAAVSLQPAGPPSVSAQTVQQSLSSKEHFPGNEV